MPSITSSAPAKIILFGEHAVVYGRPAIAVPVTQVKAKVSVTANIKGNDVVLQAPAIGLDCPLSEVDPRQPMRVAILAVAASLGVAHIPACTVRITSSIPVASGLGSGAAVSVALIRAFSHFLGRALPDEKVNELAFEVEKIHHGAPSGIDNTVIVYNKPIYFVAGKPILRLKAGRAFTIVIGDTGEASPTIEAVAAVRQGWQKDKDHFEALFDSAGALADAARTAIEAGGVELLGPLMDANHGVLAKMGVSSAALDRLVLAARRAGALGAKLSGGGRGGNMIALASPKNAENIAAALMDTGAAGTIVTTIES